MTANYCQHDINMLYPENWQLTEMECEDGNPGLSLESPDGVLMILQFFRTLVAPSRLLDDMAESLVSQYEDIEFAPVHRSIGPVSVEGKDAWFYCLDFLVQSRMLVFDIPNYRVAAVSQAEGRLFTKMELVFDAILASLARPTEA